jgi:hypothetical protein
MLNDNELERLARDYATIKVFGKDDVIPSRYENFKAGFKAAEQMMKNRFPSEQEMWNEGIAGCDEAYHWLKQKLFGDEK